MPDPASAIDGKDRSLLVRDVRLGLLETPLAELRKHEITPVALLFARQHETPEESPPWFRRMDPPPADVIEKWSLHVGGSVNRPREVSIAELRKLPQEKRVAVLQCSGNGRAFYAAGSVDGEPWQHGAMANLEWEGVSLRVLREALGITCAADAAWLTVEGWTAPRASPESQFAKSCPLDHPALAHAIVALTLNGQPIPAIHGGPLRLVMPGLYGCMYVKMLKRLLFTDAESDNAYQAQTYRMPLELPSDAAAFGIDSYTRHNSRPSYGHAIKSVIFSPLSQDKLSAGEVEISGVAFNDGLSAIAKVEVSTDGGTNWRQAALGHALSPWAWRRWSLQVRLGAGAHRLMSRATAANGDTQPLDGMARWNPRGYEWNGVDGVDVTI